MASINNKKQREFLFSMAKTACSVSIIGAAIALYARQANSMPALAIRPPGALSEDEFVSRCVRCGLCVRDCPYDILSLVSAPH